MSLAGDGTEVAGRIASRVQVRACVEDLVELGLFDAGQAADCPRFVPVLEGIRVRGPARRPRTRPDTVAGDKAHSSRGNRLPPRKRGIEAVIPETRDQAANRKRKGSRGARPVDLIEGRVRELLLELRTLLRTQSPTNPRDRRRPTVHHDGVFSAVPGEVAWPETALAGPGPGGTMSGAMHHP
ncbi:hypothetical protein ABIA38_005567 [Embleya sp. AB8]